VFITPTIKELPWRVTVITVCLSEFPELFFAFNLPTTYYKISHGALLQASLISPSVPRALNHGTSELAPYCTANLSQNLACVFFPRLTRAFPQEKCVSSVSGNVKGVKSVIHNSLKGDIRMFIKSPWPLYEFRNSRSCQKRSLFLVSEPVLGTTSMLFISAVDSAVVKQNGFPCCERYSKLSAFKHSGRGNTVKSWCCDVHTWVSLYVKGILGRVCLYHNITFQHLVALIFHSLTSVYKCKHNFYYKRYLITFKSNEILFKM
jgi:hypothetical protein